MPRVAAAPLAVLIGLPMAACFIKPDPPQGTPPDDAQIRDAPVDVPTTTDPCLLRDDFATGTSCGTWASPAVGGTGTIGRTSGQLEMSASASPGSASCTAVAAIPWGVQRAITIKVADFMNVNGAFTGLRAIDGSGQEFGFDIRGTGIGNPGMLVVHHPSGMAATNINVTAPVYIQIFAPDSQTFGIAMGATAAEVQSTGVTVSLGAAPIDSVRVRIQTSAPGTATAEFDDLDTCTPRP